MFSSSSFAKDTLSLDQRVTQRFGQNGETGHGEVQDLMSFDHSIQVPVNVRGSPRELVTSEDKQTCEHMMQPPDSKRNAKIT